MRIITKAHSDSERSKKTYDKKKTVWQQNKRKLGDFKQMHSTTPNSTSSSSLGSKVGTTFFGGIRSSCSLEGGSQDPLNDSSQDPFNSSQDEFGAGPLQTSIGKVLSESAGASGGKSLPSKWRQQQALVIPEERPNYTVGSSKERTDGASAQQAQQAITASRERERREAELQLHEQKKQEKIMKRMAQKGLSFSFRPLLI